MCTSLRCGEYSKGRRPWQRPPQGGALQSRRWSSRKLRDTTFSCTTVHLLVCIWTVMQAFPRMIGSLILSPPWFPVLPCLVICPSPIGGGAIRSGRDITPSHGAQDAQAQAEQHKTCKHVQAPSMTKWEWKQDVMVAQ